MFRSQILTSENWTDPLFDTIEAEQGWGQAVIAGTLLAGWFILSNFLILQLLVAAINEVRDRGHCCFVLYLILFSHRTFNGVSNARKIASGRCMRCEMPPSSFTRTGSSVSIHIVGKHRSHDHLPDSSFLRTIFCLGVKECLFRAM